MGKLIVVPVFVPGEPTALQQQREGTDARADQHDAGLQPVLQAGPYTGGPVHIRARAVSTHTHTDMVTPCCCCVRSHVEQMCVYLRY